MSFVLDFFRDLLQTMLELFSFGRKKISNKLSIFIKTTNGKSLSVELDPKWDIERVKELVAPQLGMEPSEVKIIFAGKELEDSTIISVSFCHLRKLIGSNEFLICRNAILVSKVSYTLSKPAHESTKQRLKCALNPSSTNRSKIQDSHQSLSHRH